MISILFRLTNKYIGVILNTRLGMTPITKNRIAQQLEYLLRGGGHP